MELAMKIKSKVAGIPGLVSIISALLGLAYFNVEYLTKMNTSISPYVFFIMASVSRESSAYLVKKVVCMQYGD